MNNTKVFSQSKSFIWFTKVFTIIRMFGEIYHLKNIKKTIRIMLNPRPYKIRRDESRLLLAKSLDIQNELEIQSQIQSKENNISNT